MDLLIHIVIIIIAILVLFGQLLVTRFDRLAKIFGGPEQRGSKNQGSADIKEDFGLRTRLMPTCHDGKRLNMTRLIFFHSFPVETCWIPSTGTVMAALRHVFVSLITAHFSMSRYVEPTLWRSQLPSLRLRAASVDMLEVLEKGSISDVVLSPFWLLSFLSCSCLLILVPSTFLLIFLNFLNF